MGQGLTRIAVAILSGIVILPTPTAASDGGLQAHALNGNLDATGSVTLTGTLSGDAQLAGISYESQWKNGPAELSVEVTDARVVVINDPRLEVFTKGLGPAPPTRTEQHLPKTELRNFTFTGSIRIAPHAQLASIRILPGSGLLPVHINHTGRQNLDPPFVYFQPNLVNDTLYMPGYGARQMVPSLPAGRLGWSSPGNVTLDVPAEIFAYEAALTFTDETGYAVIETGETTEPLSSDPLAYSTVKRHDQVYAIVESSHARLVLHQSAANLWAYQVTEMDAHFQGDAAFSAVTRTTVDRRFVDQSLGLLQAIGTFDLRGRYEAGGARWSLNGEATFFAVDGKAVDGVRGSLVALLSASAGIGLGALLLAFTRLGKDLAYLVFGYNRADPLQSPTRIQMLELILTERGPTTDDLVRRLGVKRPSVAFHAAILRKAGLIEVLAVGRRHRYVPVAEKGQPGPAVWLPQSVVRSAILEALRTSGEMDYKRLAAALQAMEIRLARNLFHYHARALEVAGHIQRVRVGRRVLWRLTNSPTNALTMPLTTLDGTPIRAQA